MTQEEIGKIKKSKRLEAIKSLAEELSTKEMIGLFIDVLPELERKVLRLHFWKGMNFSQVGHQLKLKTSTVSLIYEKALDRLRHKKKLILNNYKSEVEKC